MQIIPFELNLRKENGCLCVFIDLLGKKNNITLSMIVDHCSSIYDNHMILGDFN